MWGTDINTSLKEKNPHPKNCKVVLIYQSPWALVDLVAQLPKCDGCNCAGGRILEEREGFSSMALQISFIVQNTSFLLNSLVVGYLFLLNTVFLTGLIGDYKSHHPRHL